MINTESGSKRIESSSVEQAQIEWAITEQMMNGVYVTDGGIGSGFFKHLGRKGKVGGSVKQGVARAEPQEYRTIDHAEANRIASSMRQVPTLAQYGGMPRGDADYLTGKWGRGYGYFNTPNSYNLNTKLREGAELDGSDNNTIKMMDKYMAPMPYGIEVYRMIDSDALFNVFGIKPKKFEQLVGGAYVDKGYMSTSFDMGENLQRTKDMQIRIKVPKGSKGFFSPSRIDDHILEAEIAFARGSGLVITGISREPSAGTKSGFKYIVDAELFQE